jgi:hypothetical protein
MKIKKNKIIKSSLIKRIYSGIKSIKIYIDFFNDDNLYITTICKMFKWWTFDLYLEKFQIIKDLHLKERPLKLGNNVLLYYNNKNHVLKIYVPKQKSEDAFFGTIKHDSNKSLIKAKSLINNDSVLISLKDYYNIKSIDINNLQDNKLNTFLNFFIKIQKVETPKRRNKKNYKKNEFSILGIYFLLNNGTNIKKIYINR